MKGRHGASKKSSGGIRMLSRFMLSKQKITVLCLAIALAMFAAGCKKKVAAAPPPPPPPPPTEPTVMAPAPAAPTAPAAGAEDSAGDAPDLGCAGRVFRLR